MKLIAPAAALGVAQAVVVAVLAFWLHPMEIANSEMDAYVVHVQAILGGSVTYDGYHPVNTGLWGAAIAWATGLDPFSALRILGALATGATVAGTYVLARQFCDGAWPWLAAAVLTGNSALVTNGMQAASDMPATAVCVWTMVAGAAAARSTRWREAFWLGLSFGTAMGTRFSSAGLAPLLLGSVLGGLRWSRSCAAGIGVGIGFLPQALAAWTVRGNPLATDNWQNIALKQGDFDPSRLFEPGANSVGELLAQHGSQIFDLGLADLLSLVRGGLGKHLLGGGPAWAAAATVAAVGLGLVIFAWRGRAAGRLVVGAALSYLALVCWTFAPLERLLLPLLPVMAVALVVAASTVRWRAAAFVAALPIVAIAATALLRLPDRLRRFVDDHPHAEVAACRQQMARPGLVALASTFAPMGRYVAGPIEYLMPSGLSSWGDAPLMVTLAIARAREVGANVLIAGRRSHPRWHEVLRTGELPAGVVREQADDDVVVLSLPTTVVEGDAVAPWLAAFTAIPNEWREGPLCVRWRLPAGVDGSRVRRARVHLQAPVPVGDLPTFALERTTDNCLEAIVHFRPPPGTWRLQGRLMLDDGTQLFGPSAEVVVQ